MVDRSRVMWALRLVWLASTLVAVLLVALTGVLRHKLAQRQAAVGTSQAVAAQLVTSSTGHGADYQTVWSDYGYSMTYDNHSFTADGRVPDVAKPDAAGSHFQNDALWQVPRGYISVDLTLRQAGQTVPPVLRIETNAGELPDQPKPLDALTKAEIAAKQQLSYPLELQRQEDVSIAGTAYRRLVFERQDTLYGVATRSGVITYLTIQNHKAYSVSILGIDDLNESLVSSYETVVSGITYIKPKADLLLTGRRGARPAGIRLAAAKQVADARLFNGVANVPKPLDNRTALEIVAKNQPAVVRIASAYCADIALGGPKLSPPVVLNNACAAVTGSGTIVSSDGYVATNGHVVRVSPREAIIGYVDSPDNFDVALSHLQTLADYFVDSGLISRENADLLTNAAKAGIVTVDNKFYQLVNAIPADEIEVMRQQYQYSVQTSNQPMQASFTGGVVKLRYSASVLPARLVVTNYTPPPSGDIQDTFSIQGSSLPDVALLKITSPIPNAPAAIYPTITLGDVDKVAVGNPLTAIGFPVFVDGGLATAQPTTVPSITRGTIKYVSPQTTDNYHRLLLTSVLTAPGSSGGPALTDSGEQVGITTYSQLDCLDDNCFGDSIARDIAGFRALLKQQGISLRSDSPVSNQWHRAIDLYQKGNFTAARRAFLQIQAQHPSNYLAPRFAELAGQQSGGVDDTSRLMRLYQASRLGAMVTTGLSVTLMVVWRAKPRRTVVV